VDNLPNLWMIELYGNKIAKLERGSWVSDLPNLLYLQIQNNEIAQVEPGALNLPKLQYLDLSGNKIAKLEPGAVGNLSSLEYLNIYDNPLGCVSGVADHVQIDPGALSNGFYETPRCPENCTINTYYDADKHVCLSCPENTYRDGLALSTARLSL
jgi:hypothetical protein